MAKKPRRTVSEETSHWLDDEDDIHQKTHKREKQKKKQKLQIRKAVWLKPDEANGTVKEVFKKICRVRMDETGDSLLCPYRRADVFHESFDGFKERTPVSVGDRVKVKVLGSTDGVVEGISERENYLIRPAPGREEGMIHVIVANIDRLVIVTSVADPEFSPGLVDRFLVASQMSGIKPILCVNKQDLKTDETLAVWNEYEKIGFDVFSVSAKQGSGVDELKKALMGHKVAFCGHSGVGKTSLLQVLTGEDLGRVGEVSEVTGKGRHTTTGAILIDGPAQSRWIDTPGVRNFGLHKIKAEELSEFFPEFKTVSCKLEDCDHIDQEGCQVTEFFRYSSYRRIHQSLLEGEY